MRENEIIDLYCRKPLFHKDGRRMNMAEAIKEFSMSKPFTLSPAAERLKNFLSDMIYDQKKLAHGNSSVFKGPQIWLPVAELKQKFGEEFLKKLGYLDWCNALKAAIVERTGVDMSELHLHNGAYRVNLGEKAIVIAVAEQHYPPLRGGSPGNRDFSHKGYHP